MNLLKRLKYYAIVLYVYVMFVPFMICAIIGNLWQALKDVYSETKRDLKDVQSEIKHIKRKCKSHYEI